jgi:hypothetical protein
MSFPDRAEDQLEWAAIGGVVVLALIGLYLLTPDLIAWTGAGSRWAGRKLADVKAKVKARNERTLKERGARR